MFGFGKTLFAPSRFYLHSLESENGFYFFRNFYFMIYAKISSQTDRPLAAH